MHGCRVQKKDGGLKHSHAAGTGVWIQDRVETEMGRLGGSEETRVRAHSGPRSRRLAGGRVRGAAKRKRKRCKIRSSTKMSRRVNSTTIFVSGGRQGG